MTARPRHRSAAPRGENRAAGLFLPAFAGILLLAAVLRFADLGAAPLWADEAMSHRLASLGPGELVTALRTDSGPPVYYLLLGGWMRLFGDDEATLRALSALAGVGLVALVGGIGRRALGDHGGLVAAGVAAVSPSAVAFAREARVYPVLAVAALGSGWLLWRLLDRPTTGRAAAWAAAALALAGLHNYGLFVLACQAVAGALLARDRHGRIALGAALVAVAAGYLPWVTVLRAQLAAAEATAWMGEIWRTGGPVGALGASLASMGGGRQPPWIGAGVAEGVAVWAPWLFALLAAGGLVALARARPRLATWLGIAALGPLALGLALSLAGRPVYLPGRIDQAVLPFWWLLVGAGVTALPAALPRLAAIGALLVAGGLAASQIPTPAPDGLQAAAATVAESWTPGTLIVTTGLTRPELEYELRNLDGIRWISYPAEVAAHPGNLDPALWRQRPDRLAADAAATAAALAAADRAFLVFVPDALNAPLFEALRRSPAAARTRHLGAFVQPRLGTTVDLFAVERGGG